MFQNQDFKKYCDYIIDGAYGVNEVHIRNSDARRVYLNGEGLNWELELQHLINQPDKFELFYFADRPFSHIMFSAIRPKVTHVYATNCEVIHPMVTQLPNMVYDVSCMPEIKECERDIMCYMNFGMLQDATGMADITSRHIRRHCHNSFKGCAWVMYEGNIDRKLLYTRYRQSHFCLCPQGRGVDTTKIYEAAWYGCRPVVTSSPLDALYRKFGAVIVDDWSDVTEEFLKEKMAENIIVDRSVFTPEHYLENKST
jgi:hypothetical protein